MTASRFNGSARRDLKERAAELRSIYNGGDLSLHRGLDEFVIEGVRYLRYPDGKFRDDQARTEFDPARLIEPPASDLDDIGEERATVQYQGRPYVREVDGAWRDEHGRTLRRTQHATDGWVIEEPPRLWSTSSLTKWLGKAIPPRRWFIEEWLPVGQCAGLYGIPGARKSLWVLQAMISGALGHHFLGLPVEAGPVLGLFCEDDDEEIGRRAYQILRRYGRSFGDLGNCHYTTLVGARMTEFVRFTRAGTMSLTPAFTTFREQILDIKPRLAALDVGPDFFGGNENNRSEVHAYVRLLDGTAQEGDCALIFSAHPSRRGIAQGSLDSGSTGWEGKVRARLVLHDPDVDEDNNLPTQIARHPSNERVLTRAKCNYAAPGEQIALVLEDGVFVPKNIDPASATRRGPMRDKAAEAKFLELMEKVKAAGDYVNNSPNTKAHYAPKVFARHSDRGDFTESEFENAMNRMFGKRIRLDEQTRSGRKHIEFSEI